MTPMRRLQGAKYALEIGPQVRAPERDMLLSLLDVQPHHIICDAPAWDGIIGAAISDHSRLICIEPDEVFARDLRSVFPNAKVINASVGMMPIPSASVDRVASLVGLHHRANQISFFKEAYRILRPGGRLVVAEVAAGSLNADFLNTQIHRMTLPRGHQGKFWHDGDCTSMLSTARFVASERLINLTWSFKSYTHATDYCRALFGLESSDTEILQTLETSFGETLNIPWTLIYGVGVK